MLCYVGNALQFWQFQSELSAENRQGYVIEVGGQEYRVYKIIRLIDQLLKIDKYQNNKVGR